MISNIIFKLRNHYISENDSLSNETKEQIFFILIFTSKNLVCQIEGDHCHWKT